MICGYLSTGSVAVFHRRVLEMCVRIVTHTYTQIRPFLGVILSWHSRAASPGLLMMSKPQICSIICHRCTRSCSAFLTSSNEHLHTTITWISITISLWQFLSGTWRHPSDADCVDQFRTEPEPQLKVIALKKKDKKNYWQLTNLNRFPLSEVTNIQWSSHLVFIPNNVNSVIILNHQFSLQWSLNNTSNRTEPQSKFEVHQNP